MRGRRMGAVERAKLVIDDRTHDTQRREASLAHARGAAIAAPHGTACVRCRIGCEASRAPGWLAGQRRYAAGSRLATGSFSGYSNVLLAAEGSPPTTRSPSEGP